MVSTIDGRIMTEHWGDSYNKFDGIYEECHNSFNSDAWMVGRVTMEVNFTEGLQPELIKPEKPMERMAFVADKNAASFAIAVDPKGKLGWAENEIDGDHIIELLTESVTDDYLYYLQRNKISYILAGRDTVEFKLALEQLHDLFGIKTLMLEGGGHINGSLLNAGLIDELSLLILPLVDGTPKTPTTFEVSEYLEKNPATELKLKEVQQLRNDVLWLKYEVAAKG
jgi:riboflavin biosynthesis pyrimidine reductase